jgi:hypothetical protein
VLEKETHDKSGDHAVCLSSRVRTPRIVIKGVQSKLDWFQDVISALTVHTISSPAESLIDNILDTQRSEATTVIVKLDRNFKPHALIIKNTMTRRIKHDEHVFSLFAAASQVSHPSQIFIVTEKTGISLHRQAADKPVSSPLSQLLTSGRGARMFPLDLTENQQIQVKAVRSKPGVQTSIAARINNIDLQNSIFIERALNLREEELIKFFPGSTVEYGLSEDYLPCLHTHDCGMVMWDVTLTLRISKMSR